MVETVEIPASFTKACDFIKGQGFTHVKVELEAKLNRRRNTGDRCTDCQGVPCRECNKCGAHGFIQTGRGPFTKIIECPGCHGERYTNCVTCDGRGYTHGGPYNEAWCQKWLLTNMPKPIEKSLTFAKFYYDPSVDSEFTFTLPTSKAHMVIDAINAFNGLANVIGYGLDVSNAGMHISVLPEGKYPCAQGLLNARKLANFEKQVTPLLPALYFLATHTSQTRKLSFRLPRISDDQKSSAIYTHGGTSLEYRIFDPCFDKPEAFYDKLEVIAQTLKFYSFKEAPVEYKAFRMGNTQSLTKLAALYGDSDNYEALTKTIAEVKPDKTLTTLKKERRFNVSKAAILREQAKKTDLYKTQYKAYVADYKSKHKYRIDRIKEDLTDYAFGRYKPSFTTQNAIIQNAIIKFGHTPVEILKDKQLLAKFYAKYCFLWGWNAPKPLLTEEQYVEARILDMSHRLDPTYEITPTKPMDSDREDLRMVF